MSRYNNDCMDEEVACSSERQQGQVERLLEELGENGHLFDLSHRLNRLLTRLTGPEPKGTSDAKPEPEPHGLIDRAHRACEGRQRVVNELHELVSRLEDLV